MSVDNSIMTFMNLSLEKFDRQNQVFACQNTLMRINDHDLTLYIL